MAPEIDRFPSRLLARMERDAVIACLGMALAALVLGRGRPDVSLGVLGGGALAAISYVAIKGGVDVVVRAVARAAASTGAEAPGVRGTGATQSSLLGGAEGEGSEDAAPEKPLRPSALRRRQQVLAFVNFFIRYALLAVGAYVMLTRLHLHPVGLVAGVSAPVVAVAAELVRLARGQRR